jgi:hypothetical protein
VPLAPVPLTAYTTTYNSDRANAVALASDLRDNPACWLIRESDATLTSAHKASASFAQDRTVRLVTFFGVAGCGKTTAARNYLVAQKYDLTNITWAFPSALVAADTLKDPPADRPLGPRARSGQYTEAYEIFRKGTLSTVVIDDFTRWPPGTLDLLIYTNRDLETVILTGDPTQSHTSFPRDGAQTRAFPSFGTDVLNKVPAAPYATITHRLAPHVAATLGLQTTSQAEGDFLFASKAPPDVPILVTSERFAQTKTAGGAKAYCTPGSQGLNCLGDYCLDLAGMSNTMMEGAGVVGLTRGTRNVFLSVDPTAQPLGELSWGTSTIISALVAVSAAYDSPIVDEVIDRDRLVARRFAEHVRQCVPSLRLTAPPLALIGALSDGLPSAQTAPATTTTVTEGLQFFYPHFGPLPRVHDAEAPRAPLPQPTGPSDPILLFKDEEFPDCFARELHYGTKVSRQLPPHRHPGALHHQRGDFATEQASLAKRIHTATPEQNQASFSRRSTSSRFVHLKTGFTRVFPRFSQTRDMTARLEDCFEHVFDSWVQKRTLAGIHRHLRAEAVDWDLHQTRLFLKAQVVRKTEKWMGKAAPGQIITEFSFVKTLRDAAYALLIERVVLEECPEHVYLHLRRSTADLEAWCTTHLADYARFTETDYTAWDSSVDAPFFKFDAWIMERLGIPDDYIATYLDEAVSTRSFRGNLRLMQHSGNRYTFLFNCLRNLALSNHTYVLRKAPQAYGGDDSLIAGHPTVSSSFDASSWLMRPKVQRTAQGHLFGHLVTDGQLTYDYEYMLNRLRVAITERPRDRDFFRSFADQMTALPRPDSVEYAVCFDLLVDHCHQHRLLIDGVPSPGPERPRFTPQSVFSGVLSEFFPKTWAE